MLKVWLAVAVTVFFAVAAVYPLLLAFPVFWLLLGIGARLSLNRTGGRIRDRIAHRYSERPLPAWKAQMEHEAELLRLAETVKQTAAAEKELDIDNPTAVIRRRCESGALYVPIGPCTCTAYPQSHRHAGSAPVRSAPAKPVVKPCTEGGPCRAVDREIIRDPAGNRVASRCTRCERERYWLPFLQKGEAQ